MGKTIETLVLKIGVIILSLKLCTCDNEGKIQICQNEHLATIYKLPELQQCNKNVYEKREISLFKKNLKSIKQLLLLSSIMIFAIATTNSASDSDVVKITEDRTTGDHLCVIRHDNHVIQTRCGRETKV